MILPEFEYIAPPTLEEACSLAADLGGDAKLIAGGTDVVVAMKEKKLTPKYIIDLKKIEGLEYIDFDEKEGWKIGALTKLRTLEKSELLKEKFRAVSDAAHYVASTQVRAKGTMAGNMINGIPSADTVPILLAMDAKIVIKGADHTHICPISEFYTGLKKNILEPGDIVTEIQIPALEKNQGAAYIKHSVRKAMDLAIVGVAAVITVENGICKDAKITLGAVSENAMHAIKAEEYLKGKELTDEVIAEAGKIASTECSPIFDVRASAEYRTDMVRVFTKRSIKKAIESIKNN